MAAVINITCPNCANASKAPAELAGKKIKCKNCKTVFMVQSAAPKAAPAKKATAKTAKAKAADEDEIDKNPYGVRDENLAARCPFCALPLDPPDARICLHCGYDMQKRNRVESKKTLERQPMDYFKYHLGTILAFIGICILVAIDIISLIYRNDLMEGSWFETDTQGVYLIKPAIVPFYVTLISLLGIVPCFRIIWKRLINFTPPEVVVKDNED